jgi:hypothetical protein
MNYSQRYAFAPSIIILLLMIEQSFITSKTLMRMVAILFVVVAFVSNSRQLEHLDFMATTAPSWQTEIQHWRLDNSYKPKVWPYRSDWQWDVDLTCKPKSD